MRRPRSRARSPVALKASNLFLFSEQFDNAVWNKQNVTVTPDATTAPDSNLTADKIVEAAVVSSQHYIRQSIQASAGTAYTLSIYVKAAERFRFRVEFPVALFANNERGIFDVSAGTVVSSSGGTPTIRAVGNGWYQITQSGICTTGGSAIIALMVMPDTGTVSLYDGDGVSGLYVWGAQLNIGPRLTPYKPT